MTIDERLEALTQTVELLAAMHRDNEARFDREIQELKTMAQKDGENIRALTGIARDALQSIKGLENIAAAHEHRISKLEGDAA